MFNLRVFILRLNNIILFVDNMIILLFIKIDIKVIVFIFFVGKSDLNYLKTKLYFCRLFFKFRYFIFNRFI